jgi:mRNA degradation ribonuclease J1/J2
MLIKHAELAKEVGVLPKNIIVAETGRCWNSAAVPDVLPAGWQLGKSC